MKILYPFLLLGLVMASSFSNSAPAQSWALTSAPTNAWYSVTCSGDGARMAAVANPGLIYISADSGATWVPTHAPSNNWYSIASSASGTNIIAAGGGSVFTSVDGGLTWRSNEVAWSATPATAVIAAMSADGNILLAGGQRIGIFTSTNGGAIWTSNNFVFPISQWVSAACAANGARMYVVQEGPYGIWSSTNYGAGWAPLRAPGNLQWQGMAVSALGQRLAVMAYQSGIYVSTNFGTTWRITSAPVALNWQAIAGSADGSELVATAGIVSMNPNRYGPIYLSSDGGTNWNHSDAPTNTWASVASSADGHAMVAVVDGGGIYTLRTPPAPILNSPLSDNRLLLKWTIPSSRFRLQQATDLAAADWSDVTMPRTVDLTNLQNQVALPLAAHQAGFFRLVSP